jgi:hypothetical protein
MYYNKLECFNTARHFYPSLKIVGKVRSLPTEQSNKGV